MSSQNFNNKKNKSLCEIIFQKISILVLSLADMQKLKVYTTISGGGTHHPPGN